MADRKGDQRLAVLFQRAVDLAPEERTALIERECAGDPALRSELEALLREDRRGTAGVLRGTALKGPPPPVERIGDFRLLELLGEGGMGVVYLAEQESPVHRRVALKMIRFGLQTPEVAARFERERQALARMNHPAVAEIFASGTTDAGRPWFAMEYVPGPPITQYCDAERLSLAERLELFRRVCDGVQHAHQRGVMHRDLKPTNVLVTASDGVALPKIIDFGVAQAVAGVLGSPDYRTTLGRAVGTYLFMSPEQADPERPDVDTRTDVFALGVLLYELLTGASPYRDEVVRSVDPARVQRAVLEDEPPRPSARVERLGEDLAGVAAARRETPKSLPRRLAGDLDWIALKALEKDRSRRYGSASDLSADIERHLASLPVVARPPSTRYRTARFVRRHRVLVGLLVLAAVCLVAALIAVSVAWRESARALAAESARNEAVARRARDAEDRLRFFQHAMFGAPPGTPAEPLTAELIDRAGGDIPRLFGQDPASEAAVRQAVGRAYLVLGKPEQARDQLLRAYALQAAAPRPDDLELFNTLEALIRALRLVGGLDAGEPYATQSLQLALRLVGDRDPSLYAALSELAAARDAGVESAPSPERVRALLAEGNRDRDTAPCVNRVLAEVGLALHRAGARELSEAYFRELEAASLEDLDETGFILQLWRYGDSYLRYAPELPERAAELARELLARIEGRLPAGHWMHAEAQRILGLALARMGPKEWAGAEQALLEARDLAAAAPDPLDPRRGAAAGALGELVAILVERGELEAFLADSFSRWRAGARATPWWPSAESALPPSAAASVRAYLDDL